MIDIYSIPYIALLLLIIISCIIFGNPDSGLEKSTSKEKFNQDNSNQKKIPNKNSVSTIKKFDDFNQEYSSPSVIKNNSKKNLSEKLHGTIWMDLNPIYSGFLTFISSNYKNYIKLSKLSLNENNNNFYDANIEYADRHMFVEHDSPNQIILSTSSHIHTILLIDDNKFKYFVRDFNENDRLNESKLINYVNNRLDNKLENMQNIQTYVNIINSKYNC